MKLKYIAVLALAFGVLSVVAQSTDAPSGINIFSTQTLTNVYTASTVMDCQSYNSASIIASIGTTQNVGVVNFKPQWSNDSTIWADIPVTGTNGVNSSQEVPFTFNSKMITMSLSNSTPSYLELYPRSARYFRVVVKSTNVFTTGTLNITAQKLNNSGVR